MPAVTVKMGSEVLKKDLDYTLSYDDNVYVGTATVTITGKGKYKGAVKKTFSITSAGYLTIKFNANGGKVTQTSKKVSKGSTYGTLPTPTYKGYKFQGWYTAKTSGKKVDKASHVTLSKSITLYASWKKITYTIKYSLNGGTNSKKNPASYTITTKKIILQSPAKKGYKFEGWYSDSNYQKKVSSIAKGSTGNKKLYAKWTPIQYTIAFKGNGAASGKMSNVKLKYNKEIRLPSNKFVRKGYVFAGWSTSENGTVKYGNTSKVKNLTVQDGKTIILYAIWKKKVTSITNDLGTSVTIYNPEGSYNGFSYTAFFNEKYFKGGNSVQKAQDGLARLSAVGALSTYKNGQTGEFLKSCGFAKESIVKKITGASNESSNDNATVYLGTKKMTDGSVLIAIIINGYTNGGYEWISNFNLGTGRTHSGFDIAANKLIKIINTYIEQHKGTENHLWITGHSRGGALTNMVAMKLINAKKYGINNSNVYAYGFATPRYSRDGGKYDSIINCVSPHDFVPDVAPEAWGYVRTGTNIIFDEAKANTMKSKYKSFTRKAYDGYTVSQKNRLINAFVDLGGNPKEYEKKKTWTIYLKDEDGTLKKVLV